jgi:hypothetical protein
MAIGGGSAVARFAWRKGEGYDAGVAMRRCGCLCGGCGVVGFPNIDRDAPFDWWTPHSLRKPITDSSPAGSGGSSHADAPVDDATVNLSSIVYLDEHRDLYLTPQDSSADLKTVRFKMRRA